MRSTQTISRAGRCLMVIGAIAFQANDIAAQCGNNNTFAGSFTPTCAGVSAGPCIQAGTYWNMTVVAGNTYEISTCGGAGFDTYMTLYNGGAGANLAFNDDFCGLESQITWLATYSGTVRILIDEFPCASSANCANITVTCSTPLANDDPCGATALAVGPSCSYTASTNNGATLTTGIPAPICGNLNAGSSDVWFSFIAPASGSVILGSQAGTMTDGAFALYSATNCSTGFSLIECDDDDGPGFMPEMSRTGLTPGTTYYIRYWGFGAGTGTFDICVYQPQTNDDPCGATALAVGSSCSYTASSNVSTTLSAGLPAPGCGNLNGASSDVWFSFVAPASGSVIMASQAGTLTDGAFALYSATSCSAGFNLIECDDDDGPGFMPYMRRDGLTPGTTYYVRYWGFGANTGTFDICVYEPNGDEPCEALSIGVGASCSFSTFNNSSMTRTTSVGAPSCSNFNNNSRDIWFTFTAPASGAVSLETQSGGMTNGKMAVYSATSCSGAFTEVACDNNSGPGNMPELHLTGLIAGDTYYVRIWSNGGNNGTFDLCLYEPAFDCTYELHMFDDFGDGWGGSTVGVSINGGAFTNYTVTGTTNTATFGVNIGDQVRIEYSAAGGFQNDIRYALGLEPGVIFFDGPSPTTGIVYTGIVDCVPEQAPREDCRGGVTICNAQTLSGGAQHTGIAADLTPANRGCLGSNERQGAWYHFSPSASGTVQMTISPSAAPDDYDFAIWGPFPSLDCNISTAPVRCSFAGTAGPTGLRTGSGDSSEGLGGDRFVDSLSVTAGEVYMLYISNFAQSGLSYSIDWTLTGGSSLDCTILPIELLSFNAVANGQNVEVLWSTITETNNDHFVVERSEDGETFKPIGTRPGEGNSNQLIEYGFVDEQPAYGMNYYRLLQVDHDGNGQHSSVVAVDLRSLAGSVPHPFPVPADHLLNVLVDVPVEGEHTYHVFDASGRSVRTERITSTAGMQRIQLSTSNLPNGAYVMELSTAGQGVPNFIRFSVQH